MQVQNWPHCKMKVLCWDKGEVQLIFEKDADKKQILGVTGEITVKLSKQFNKETPV